MIDQLGKWTRRFFCIVSLVLMGAASASASPVFYGVAGANLVRFDMGAQTITLVAPMQSGETPPPAVKDPDFGAGGIFWVMRQGTLGGFPPQSVSQAYTVDIVTG